MKKILEIELSVVEAISYADRKYQLNEFSGERYRPVLKHGPRSWLTVQVQLLNVAGRREIIHQSKLVAGTSRA